MNLYRHGKKMFRTITLLFCILTGIISVKASEICQACDQNTDSINKLSTIPTNRDYDLYLLIGQSNMAGRAPIPEGADQNIANCFLLNNDGKWETAKNPLNRYSSVRKNLKLQKLGLGYSFAKQMIKEEPDTQLGLVVNALGGTKIDAWQKGSKLYNEAVKKIKIAKNSGKLRGILWHQGESNKDDVEYAGKLEQLIKDLRNEFGQQKLPIVIGKIKDGPIVNEQLENVSKKIDRVICISSEGLDTFDGLHFDANSQIKLGERYAKAMIQLLNK